MKFIKQRYVQRDKKNPLIHEKKTKNGNDDQDSTITRPTRDRNSGASRSTLAQWLDGVRLMAKVAALRITTSGKKVRVACGKFSDSFLPSDWGDAIANSVHRPILLNADENVDSKRIYLYRGMGFRLSSHDTIADINRAIQELQRPKPQQAPNTYSLAPFGHLQGRAQQAEPAYAVTAQPSAPFPAVTTDGMVRILLSLAKQRSLSTEGDHSYFLGIATQKGMAIAQRCVARNILKTKISRYIPQDIKIAVAIRDGGQCTHMDYLNQRCSAKGGFTV